MAPNKWWLMALLWTPLAQAAAVPGLPGIPANPAGVPSQHPAQGWVSMAPAQQREIRARYAAWLALSNAERARLRQAAAAVAALPPAQQAALRLRFSGQDRLHRDGWRLGATLGAVYPKLQPLFGYLPRAQREPVLALLGQLDDGQLAQLVLISQRTPPQERAALREQLLALAPAARGAWLEQHVNR